jgi:thiol-disulfide isomerase/thioredoxin
MITANRIIGILVLVTLLFTACKTDDPANIDPNALEDEASLVIEFSSILRNQEINLRLVDDNNTDQTQYATFYVNGTEMSNSVFSASDSGNYEIYARYNLAGTQTNTQIETVQVIIPKRKVLVEDFTATWCGYCPRMTTAIETLREATEAVVIVSIHENSQGGAGTVDPYTIPEGVFLKEYFEVPGNPWGLLNRNEAWSSHLPVEEPLMYAGIETDITLGIKSQLIGSELMIGVSVLSENVLIGTKLVVFLVEDDLVSDQSSYYDNNQDSQWYQRGNPIKDFVHNDVLRVVLTEPLGDEIIETAAYKIYTRSLTASISSEFNTDALKIVAFVVDVENNVRNAQFAHLNENKPFE